MSMALQCDICGGMLEMAADGKSAVCQSCGMPHSLERVRIKIQEIKGTVQIEGTVSARQTGTAEDVEQWRALLGKYMAAGDYQRALDIVGKILESLPADPEANAAYDELQILKDMTVKNGVLEKYSGEASALTIPEGIHTIKGSAFAGCHYLEKVRLPSTARRLEAGPYHGPFGYLKNLRTIELNEGLEYIGSGTFMGCGSLADIAIPGTVNEIGSEVFKCCSALRRTDLSGIGRVSLKGMFCGCSSLEEVLLPDSVDKIDDEAFMNCVSLAHIMIPKGVKTIGVRAFSGCGAIKAAELPEGVAEIGDMAFENCGALAAISIPNSVNKLGKKAFRGCHALKNVEISGQLLRSVLLSDTGFFSDTPYGEISPSFKATKVKAEQENQSSLWRKNGLCPHCGGVFTLKKKFLGPEQWTCMRCGKKKDY